ncbi:PAS domain S-box protein [Methylorubrum extorquens]
MTSCSVRSDSEAARLRALERYRVLDTPREQAFDDIAELASEICRTPIAVVNLIGEGRQFFKAEVGLGLRETPLETSFCQQAILQADFLYVPDATQDPRFEGNPLVTGEPRLRFYAGALLKTDEGYPIGTVCVLDTAPRELSDRQQHALRRLARQVMAQLELRRSLQSQRDQQRLQNQILASATDYAIIALDRGGHVTSWNEGARRTLGWSEGEVLGKSAEVFFTEQDVRDGIPEAEMHSARTEGVGTDERWHLRKDGEHFWASGEMLPLKSETGEHTGYLKILRDRTEQRLQGERLRRSEERLSLALGAAGMVGTWDWDLRKDVIYADENFARIYTVDPEHAAHGAPLSAYIKNFHPDDMPAFQTELDRLLSGEQEQFSCEYRVRQPDGSYLWLLARGRLIRDEDGAAVRFAGASVDITANKLAEQRARQSESRFRQLTELAPGIIWMGHQDGSVSYLNDFWYRYTGQTPEQALPHGWAEVIHPDDVQHLAEAWSHARENGIQYNTEARLRRHDGAYHWFLIRAEPLRDERGQITGWLGNDIDIQDRKEAEEHQRLLTGELQHRVKNTLAMVQAIAAQTFRGATDLNEAQDAFAARLISLGRAHDILTQASWTAAPIGDVVQGALSVHAQSGTSRIRTSGLNVFLAAKPALALAMALHELATNAAKYGALSTESGSVELRWHVIHEGESKRFCLTWSEQGGPPILTQPTRKGFGSRLIERSFAAEVGGEVKLTYAPSGLICRLEAPLASIQEPCSVIAA